MRSGWMACTVLVMAVLAGCGRSAPAPTENHAQVVECDVELRSWVVAGRARHLYLSCDCPEGYEELEDRIEYTTIALRWDFQEARLEDGVHRIARMTRGEHLGPVLGDPNDRLEATWRLSADVVECLQRDTVFGLEYRLLGPNSNSGIRGVAERCGLTLPDRVLRGGGMFGEFPGIELAPGDEVPESAWDEAGIVRGI